MAFGDKVQSKAAQDTTGTATFVAVTLDSAVGSGNLMVATVGSRGSAATLDISGWNAYQALDSPSHQHRGFWLAADDLASLTITATRSAADEMVLVVAEYEGPFDFAALLNTSNSASSGTGTVTSQTTGAITTTTADCLLVGGVLPINETGALGSWTASFVADQNAGPAVASDITAAQAHLAVTSTGTYSSAFSWTTAARASGIIAAFKMGAAGFDPANLDASVLGDDVTLTWDV